MKTLIKVGHEHLLFRGDFKAGKLIDILTNAVRVKFDYDRSKDVRETHFVVDEDQLQFEVRLIDDAFVHGLPRDNPKRARTDLAPNLPPTVERKLIAL